MKLSRFAHVSLTIMAYAVANTGTDRVMTDQPNAKSKQPAYFAYLLRLWWVTGMDEQAVWRASLQAARRGDILVFASPEELFRYLRRQMGTVSGTGEGQDGARA